MTRRNPKRSKFPPIQGILVWVLTHRYPRRLIPPLVLLALLALLTAPLLKDLYRLSQDDLAIVPQSAVHSTRDGNLIVNVKDLNPNNGVATLDVSYVTDKIDKGKVELWLSSGGVTLVGGGFNYEVDTELRRVPIVLESPTVFAWKTTRQAVYKQENITIKIDQRSAGYLYPFDRYIVEFSFAIIDEAREMHPVLWFEFSDPRFVHKPPKPLRTLGVSSVAVPDSVHVVLDRPTYQKIFLVLSLLMGLGSVVWSLYKITYTSVNPMESLSLLAFNFTILLAVPGLRGVFVPSNLQFAPLFDFFVVLIWTVGLLSLFVNIIKHDIAVHIRKRRANRARRREEAMQRANGFPDDQLGPANLSPQPEEA